MVEQSDQTDKALLIFHVRSSRRKAVEAAKLEAVCVLQDLNAATVKGGPLSDQPGVFWIELPESAVAAAADRFGILGYTNAVDLVRLEDLPQRSKRMKAKTSGVWKNRTFILDRLYEEAAENMRELAVDRRVFVLTAEDGSLREVRGYRGSGKRMSRRGLPVADARLLVNLTRGESRDPARLLDPFAGAGGIAIESVNNRWRTFTCDIDPIVQYGLRSLGANHCVADARRLPFSDSSFDAIATEPPFDDESTPMLVEALGELHRVLVPHGRLAMMVGGEQTEALREQSLRLGLKSRLDVEIDRKGLPVSILAW